MHSSGIWRLNRFSREEMKSHATSVFIPFSENILVVSWFHGNMYTSVISTNASGIQKLRFYIKQLAANLQHTSIRAIDHFSAQVSLD